MLYSLSFTIKSYCFLDKKHCISEVLTILDNKLICLIVSLIFDLPLEIRRRNAFFKTSLMLTINYNSRCHIVMSASNLNLENRE